MKPPLLILLLLCIAANIFAATTSAETDIFAISDDTLPVVLSSFSAQPTAAGYVTLQWTTESETELLGYRVYRSSENSLQNAQQLSPQTIPATNTSSTMAYSFQDTEVQVNNVYYYWLEIVEYNSSSFHGPISISITDSETPVLPLQTALTGIYPNPFRPGSATSIQVRVKENDIATLSIYNLAGQRVKQQTLSPGQHQLNWDGKDQRGTVCGSGIYLVQLNSPSVNQSAKVILIK